MIPLSVLRPSGVARAAVQPSSEAAPTGLDTVAARSPAFPPPSVRFAPPQAIGLSEANPALPGASR